MKTLTKPLLELTWLEEKEILITYRHLVRLLAKSVKNQKEVRTDWCNITKMTVRVTLLL